MMLTENYVNAVLKKAFTFPELKLTTQETKKNFSSGDYLYIINIFVGCTYSLYIKKNKNKTDELEIIYYVLFNVDENSGFSIRYFSTNIIKDKSSIIHISDDSVKVLNMGDVPDRNEIQKLSEKIFKK